MTTTSFYDTRNGPAIDKDPDAVLDYPIDWTDWLVEVGDSLVASTWIVPSGITKASDSAADGIAVIWLSGGTAGQTYTITNHIVTAAGRHDDRSFIVNVIDR